jgi:4-hydroxy-tetrahydrodipicolinate reductase
VEFSSELQTGIERCDLVIDFSTPASALEAARGAASLKKPILIGTTGCTAEQVEELRSLAVKVPVAVVSNTSVGVFVLRELATEAVRLLGPSFDIEIIEAHHRLKKDAPSGTALSLAEALRAERALEVVTGRSGKTGPRQDGEIGIESLRGGDVVGDHTIFFLGQGERLELTHRVTDRALFARGALRFASLLVSKGPGFYSVADLMRSGH